MTASETLAVAAGRAREYVPEVVLALAAGVSAVVASYAAVGLVPDFVGAPVATLFVALTPSIVIRYSILLLGSLGSQIAFWLAMVAAAVVFALAVALARAAVSRAGYPSLRALAGGLVALALAFLLVGDPTSAVAAGAGATLPLLVADIAAGTGTESSAGRRAVLGGIATVIGVGAVGAVLGSRGAGPSSPGGESEPTPTPDDGPASTDSGGTDDESTATDEPSTIDRLLSRARELSLDVAGLEPLVSDDFYTVDIAQIDPDTRAEDWTLTVTGAVESERTYTFDDLRSRAAVHRFESLRCVGEKLNGKKMDNALWTGVPLRPLLEEAGYASENCCVMFRAEDGYFEQFPLSALENSLLAYGMNGRALPRKHGAPVRALVPGHWGEINVKWITEIEITDEEVEGYWERRGWHGTGPVNTVAKLHVTNRLDDGRMEVAGAAYAGTRGIRSVEVSTDGGATWNEATLSDPLPDEIPADAENPEIGGEAADALRHWVYRYDPPGGRHEVVVRATDGTGTLQPRERANAFPSGPTGWVSQTVGN